MGPFTVSERIKAWLFLRTSSGGSQPEKNKSRLRVGLHRERSSGPDKYLSVLNAQVDGAGRATGGTSHAERANEVIQV